MRSLLLLTLIAASLASAENIAVRGDIVYTMAGAPVKNGVVLISNGKIERVSTGAPPSGYRVITAKVVTPGLVDAHGTLGLTGYLNQNADQDQVER